MNVKRKIKSTSRENVVEAELVRRVEALGGKCEKVQVIGCRGFFDRLIALPGGRIILCEAKRPKGGVVSAHQKKRHREYAALGVVVALIKNMDDIDQLLSESKS